MIQFNFEIASDIIAGIILFTAACVCFIQGFRKRNDALLMLGTATLAFGISIVMQGISYATLLINFNDAFELKKLSIVIMVLGYVMIFFFVNYIWFENMRLVLLIPAIIIATLEIATIYFTDDLVIYNFLENGVIIAVSIGKSGLLLILDLVLGNVGLYLLILAYFTKSFLKSPADLKRPLRFIVLFTWSAVFSGIILIIVVRFSPNGLINLIFYGTNYLLIAAVYLVIIALAIRNPQLFCILPFRVDRLLVIHNNSGLPLYEYQFSTQKVDDVLFSGLIQGLQQMSIEVLQKGRIRQIMLASGVLMFNKKDLFTVGLLSSRNSQILNRSFGSFTSAFEKQFFNALEKFNGNRSEFDEAESLIKNYFNFVPRNL